MFNAWVKRIHARVNRIPLEEQSFNAHKIMDMNDFTPTTWHKVNAFRIILVDELKKAFTFRWRIAEFIIDAIDSDVHWLSPTVTASANPI